MDAHMIDNEDNRNDRHAQDEMAEQMSQAVPRRPHLPNRKERRMIAKRRGVFKHPGAWPYVNQRSSDRTEQHLKGDHSHEDKN